MRSNKAAERLQVSGHGPPPSGTKRAGAARIASAGSRRAARATGARDSAWARHWFTTRATAPTARSAAEAPVAPRRRSFFSSLSLSRRAASFSLSLSLAPLARPPPSSRPRPRPRCSGARLASLLSLAIAPAFRRHHSIAPRLRTATAVKPQASLLFGASVCRARSKHSSPPSSLLSSSSPPSSLLRRCHRV